jgi:hypothetical protein
VTYSPYTSDEIKVLVEIFLVISPTLYRRKKKENDWVHLNRLLLSTCQGFDVIFPEKNQLGRLYTHTMANLSQVVEQVDDVGGLEFENLYPVLLQTFVVIVLG